MRKLVAATCIVLAMGCRSRERKAPPSVPGAPADMAPATTDSAAFHLEIAGVYERFQDPKRAIEHLSNAARRADDAAQRVQAYAGIARVKNAGGDLDGAIEALESARAEIETLAAAQAGADPGPTGALPMPGDDLDVQLARLQVKKGRHDEALKICDRALARAQQPWQREQLERFRIDLLRLAGALDRKIAESEKALEADPPDEPALRFLVAALAGDGMAPPAPQEACSTRVKADEAKLVRAYERLLVLHPEDLALRQTLESLLERAGRVDEAVKLIQAGPGPAADCALAFGPPSVPAALGGFVEAARIRARAGQKDKALAEVGRIAALGGREGVMAYVVAADLYRELGAISHADQILGRAAADARSSEDRRRVAAARERVAQQSADRKGLDVVLASWDRSPDPCLRELAAQRRAGAGVAGPGVAGPVAPPPPVLVPPPLPPELMANRAPPPPDP